MLCNKGITHAFDLWYDLFYDLLTFKLAKNHKSWNRIDDRIGDIFSYKLLIIKTMNILTRSRVVA